MRLSILFLTVGFLNASAGGVSQTITLRVQNAPLEKVFHEIEKQSGYSFLYEKGLLQKARPVSLEVSKAPVDQVLGLCFANQALVYSIIEKVVVVKEKEERKTEAYSVVAMPPVGEVRGRITNVCGEQLANANVVIKKTGYGTQTDANGAFILKNINPDDIIVISYTGYQSQTIKVNSRNNFTLVMDIATNELDEAVVQGYGTTTHRLSTGNIGRVTAAEIAKQPVMNPLLALQGRVAGLDVVQTSGFASAPLKVELRGRTSIRGYPSDPLYIVDGVPLTISNVSGQYATLPDGSSVSRGFLQTGSGFNGPANGQDPFFSFNPADIESIEVLKDAEATAIYGSRGANGVILITTKKGKSGKTKFDLNVQEGATMASRFWPLLNTTQYLQVRKEAFKNDKIDYTAPANAGKAYDLLSWDTTRNVDWQRELYGHNGQNTAMQAGVSGGNANTTFRIGAGYNRMTNITTVSGADQRGSLSIDLQNHSVDQKFSISLTANYSYAKSDMISLPGIIIFPPDAPAIYDSKGGLNYSGWTKNASYPFAGLKQPYTSTTNFLTSNLAFHYSPIKGLKTSVSLGYNNAQANQVFLQPIASLNPTASPTGTSMFGNNSNKNWIIEPQITYDAFINRGKLSALAGASLQQTTTDGLTVSGTGYTNDALLLTISNAPIKNATDNSGEYKYAAIFGRFVYNWENKYILTVNGRRDGSSRFGPGSQFGNFGSTSAAWIFTEEKWMKKIPVISFGKLRVSYGTTGSDAVGDYAYLTRWSSTGTNIYGNIQPLAPLQHANPYYHWQVNKKLEAGIDLGFLNDRISLGAAWYRNRCDNQLIGFPTPALSGFTTVTANSPALVENTGLEFTFFARIVDKRNITWSVSFNTAINRNKLVAYPNLAQSPFAGIYKIGSPLNMTWVYHSLGVDPQTGRYVMEDKNHDGSITYNFSNPGLNDDVSVLDLTPKFFGGVSSTLRYKTLQLDLYFTGKKQLGRNALDQGNIIPGAIANFPLVQLNGHWQQPGQQANSARFTTQPDQTDANFLMSDGVYTDASYIRLSNVSLAWSLPQAWIKKAGMLGCTLFVHANNVFVITKYKGIDPETQNFGGLPPIRTIAGGLSFNF